MKRISLFAGAALALAIAAPSTAQQQPQTVRLAGTIEAVDGSTLTVKTRQGDVKVNVTPDVTVFGVERRTIADIKPGLFLGVGGVPLPDGSQQAKRVQIFPPGESPNPGFRSWEGAPQGTMTNANVDSVVTSTNGHELTMKYKDGEKKIVIAPDAQITGTVPGNRSELKPGVAIIITRAVKKADGTFEANRVNAGRGGVVPQ
jgi:outer membrane lipoprotein SlyB